MGDDPELAKIRAQRLAEMQSQVIILARLEILTNHFL